MAVAVIKILIKFRRLLTELNVEIKNNSFFNFETVLMPITIN